MSQIEELQSRMTAALERISSGVAMVADQAQTAQAAASDADSETLARLTQSAEDEKKRADEFEKRFTDTRNRVNELKDKVARMRDEHAAELEALKQQAEALPEPVTVPDEAALEEARAQARSEALEEARAAAMAEQDAAIAQAVETAREHARAEALEEARLDAERLAEENAAKAAETTAETEAGSEAASDTDLAEALEEEKLANAQLVERLKRLKARHADEIADLETKLAASDAPATDPGPLKDEITALKQLVETRTSERDTLQQQIEAVPDVTALEAELSEARTQLAALPQIEALQAELESAQAKMADESELDALRAELAEAKQKLEGSQELDALRAELEGGSDEAAQVETLKADLDTMRSEFAVQANAMEQLDGDLQRLRVANEELRSSAEALREANAQNVGEPHLINKAMLAELEGLRALHATEVSTAGAVLSRLEPLLASAANLPEGEAE
jgi:DNA repair exonuclease SbcCD ATPase subunit